MSKLRIRLRAHAPPFILLAIIIPSPPSPTPQPHVVPHTTPSSTTAAAAGLSNNTSSKSSCNLGELQSSHRRLDSSAAMALRSAAAQAATLLRLRASAPSASLWVPLARRFSTTQFNLEDKVEPGLHYAKSHEWVKVDGEIGTIGITDHAQHALGDLVFVELPEAGTGVTAMEKFGSVESVKAVSDINSPVSGEVVEFNSAANEDPSLLNQAPYGKGWLIKVKLSDKGELNKLMDADKYATFQSEDDH